jgi:hypothetical protein
MQPANSSQLPLLSPVQELLDQFVVAMIEQWNYLNSGMSGSLSGGLAPRCS